MSRPRIAVSVVLCLLAIHGSAVAADLDAAAVRARDLSKAHAPQIVSLAARGEFRPAIAKAAIYEQEVLALYPPPRHEHGRFVCEASHFQFGPAPGWKRVELPDEQAAQFQTMAMAGFEALLNLENEDESQHLLIFCIHGERLKQRLGDAAAQLDPSSDRGLRLLATVVTAPLGPIQSQRFQTVGSHRVLRARLAGPVMGMESWLIMLPTEQRVFGFLLFCPDDGVGRSTEQLDKLVQTAKCDYCPDDLTAIEGQRARGNRQDVESLLESAECLAVLGQYNAAAEDLTSLRHLLYSRMPKAQVRGRVAACPAYGITLRNPAPLRWRLSCRNDGPGQQIIMEDRLSTRGEGIMVGVVDLLVTHGPQFVALLNSDETLAQQTLISSGRESAKLIGEIADERLGIITGDMAYEATVTPPLSGVKVRVHSINKGDYLVTLVVVLDARQYDAMIDDIDEILAENLQLEAAEDVTTTQARVTW